MERARKKAEKRGKGRMPSAASEANGRGGKRRKKDAAKGLK
jgi:hypothetical protein